MDREVEEKTEFIDETMETVKQAVREADAATTRFRLARGVIVTLQSSTRRSNGR